MAKGMSYNLYLLAITAKSFQFERMYKRRVVVTGLGVAACNGVGVEAFWKANREGRIIS